MASNPYEVEHNIKPLATKPHTRRPDMSSFTSHLHTISPESATTSSGGGGDGDQTHTAIGPTPVDAAALFRLLQDQMATLAADAPTDTNRELLLALIEQLTADVDNPPTRIRGVTQEYLDGLERVPRKVLQAPRNREEACPICAEPYVEDPYPLVVELPCHGSHRFDLECVGPWLMSKGTCPLCRKDLTEKKKVLESAKDEDVEEDDMDALYG